MNDIDQGSNLSRNYLSLLPSKNALGMFSSDENIFLGCSLHTLLRPT